MDCIPNTYSRYGHPLIYGCLAEKKTHVCSYCSLHKIGCDSSYSVMGEKLCTRWPWWSVISAEIVLWPTWYIVRISDTPCWCTILIYRSIRMHLGYEGEWQGSRCGIRVKMGETRVDQRFAAIQSSSSLNSAPMIYPFSSVYPIHQSWRTEVDIREKWCLRRWSIGTTLTIILSSYSSITELPSEEGLTSSRSGSGMTPFSRPYIATRKKCRSWFIPLIGQHGNGDWTYEMNPSFRQWSSNVIFTLSSVLSVWVAEGLEKWAYLLRHHSPPSILEGLKHYP